MANYYKQLKALLKNSSCEFSKIAVAAIIVTDKGIFKGVNYEDSVNSLSICAERNAIFNGITNGMKVIKEIHLLSNKSNMTMCGACRQVASSFASKSTMVYDYDYKTGKVKATNFGQLLPNATFLAKNDKKRK